MPARIHEGIEELSGISRKFEIIVLVITVLSGVSFQFLSALEISPNELADIGYKMYIPIILAINFWVLYSFINNIEFKLAFLYCAWVSIILAFFINNINFEYLLNYKFNSPIFSIINWLGFGGISIFMFYNIHNKIMNIISILIKDEKYKILVIILGIVVFLIIILGSQFP